MSVQFNSQIWHERREGVFPFLLSPSFEACGAPFREFFGIPFATSVLHYRIAQDGALATWLLRPQEAKTCGQLLSEALGVPSFGRYFQAAYADAHSRLQMMLKREPQHASARVSDILGRLRDLVDAYVGLCRLDSAAQLVDWWVDDATDASRAVTAPATALTAGGDGGLAGERGSIVREVRARLVGLGHELTVAAGCDQADLMWFSPSELAEPGFDFLALAEEAAIRREALVCTLSAYPLDEAEMAAMLSLAREQGEEGLPAPAGVAVYAGREACAALRRIDARLSLLGEGAAPLPLRGEVVYRAADPVYEGVCRVVVDPYDDSARELVAGEILVTAATTPDFVPLMQMAGAIVTDQAGAASHAAIVARELRIPCIVGTGQASVTLLTGQTLRLDFVEGLVVRAGEADGPGAESDA
jgi:phosphohistidine swiveling domain-containing protein